LEDHYNSFKPYPCTGNLPTYRLVMQGNGQGRQRSPHEFLEDTRNPTTHSRRPRQGRQARAAQPRAAGRQAPTQLVKAPGDPTRSMTRTTGRAGRSLTWGREYASYALYLNTFCMRGPMAMVWVVPTTAPPNLQDHGATQRGRGKGWDHGPSQGWQPTGRSRHVRATDHSPVLETWVIGENDGRPGVRSGPQQGLGVPDPHQERAARGGWAHVTTQPWEGGVCNATTR
jgi:hypothetical protein